MRRRARSPPPRARCRKLRGITTRRDLFGYRDQLGPGRQLRQVLAKGGNGQRRDVRPRKHVQDLLLGYGGFGRHSGANWDQGTKLNHMYTNKHE